MNQVLDTIKFVVERSNLVSINENRLIEFAKEFEHGTAKHWLSAAPFDLSRLQEKEKLAFIFLFNSLSFSYWGEPKWTVEYEGKQYDGAWGMVVSLGKALQKGLLRLDPEFCSKIKKEEFAEILKGNIEIPLFDSRLSIMHEIGKITKEKFSGKFEEILDKSEYDSMKLLKNIVDSFPSFKDSSVYEGREIYFWKRAQLLIADIFQFFDGKGIGDLNNIDQITACADYKLPQILRKYDILKYAPELAEKIDGKKEIISGSGEEVEIRANTIWAVENIKSEVAKNNPAIKTFEVNDHLWLATQEKFPDDKPYHRTRTTAY